MSAVVEESVIIQAWNTVLFEKFCRFRHLLVDGLSQHSDGALARCAFAPGMRVLDIGCGFGDSTLRIARSVGPGGEAVGMDCAERFIGICAADARAAGVANARFFTGDAQWDDLQGPYDHAFARFGTMFFEAPGAAMGNVRRALKPGGTFTQIVWRKREDNPWLHEAELRVKAIVPVVDPETSNQVHCGPGPFSMSGPDMVSAMLRGAGFDRIVFERHDCDICIGRDLAEAIEFAMALGPAGEVMRLAGSEAERLKPQVVAALTEALTPHARADGVWAPSSTWFITATNPG
ncbi:MAG TPA: class I SAM-dependent methyltransferase [Rhodanobacteraceae bacterium]|nr:class I SAM-dependent methyltransferase [Rhodanobacteraceae bacterium]